MFDQRLQPTTRGAILTAPRLNRGRYAALGDQWRVIYRVVAEDLTYYIESVTPHDYRRR